MNPKKVAHKRIYLDLYDNVYFDFKKNLYNSSITAQTFVNYMAYLVKIKDERILSLIEEAKKNKYKINENNIEYKTPDSIYELIMEDTPLDK